jgi:hypothetical protein
MLPEYNEWQSFRGARVKSIHLIIAGLAFSLFGIIAGEFGLFSRALARDPARDRPD